MQRSSQRVGAADLLRLLEIAIEKGKNEATGSRIVNIASRLLVAQKESDQASVTDLRFVGAPTSCLEPEDLWELSLDLTAELVDAFPCSLLDAAVKAATTLLIETSYNVRKGRDQDALQASGDFVAMWLAEALGDPKTTSVRAKPSRRTS